jgi:hypothetical protein
MLHDVDTPISPVSAEHRAPVQRKPDNATLTNFPGMRSRKASLSSVKRGQSRE